MRKKKISNSPADPKPAKPGPKLETLRVDGDWQDAMKKSLTNKKPAGGWPK